MKENYSYKLEINISPSWRKLYKKAFPHKAEEEIDKEIEKKLKDTKNPDRNLWGRSYYFTEYYDASTGLIMKFKRVRFSNEKEVLFPVEEFSDFGPFFNEDLVNPDILPLTIGEDYIRYDNKFHEDWQEENYLAKFPVFSIFNFLLALGIRFAGCERNTIIKWPDYIEEDFKKMGIKYEYQPAPWIDKIELLEIEKEDEDFFQKWGKPQVAKHYNEKETSSFSEDRTSFSVDLKIFRKGENKRIYET